MKMQKQGDHYTPREVIRLMTHLLFLHDDASILTKPGLTQTLYDCAAGTGGMGSVAQEYLLSQNPTAHLEFFGQEINPESYAICKADLLIKGKTRVTFVWGIRYQKTNSHVINSIT